MSVPAAAAALSQPLTGRPPAGLPYRIRAVSTEPPYEAALSWADRPTATGASGHEVRDMDTRATARALAVVGRPRPGSGTDGPGNGLAKARGHLAPVLPLPLRERSPAAGPATESATAPGSAHASAGAMALRAKARATAPSLATNDADAARSRILDAELSALFGAQRTTRDQLPDPAPRAAVAVRGLLEVLAGDRPARQLARWVSPGVLAGLEARPVAADRPRRGGTVVRSLHVNEPADAVAEVVAVIDSGTRCRAVALRMEGLDGRWTVVSITVC